MASNSATKPPTGLHRSGRALWTTISEGYTLDPAEGRILLEACRTADVSDALTAAIDADGVMSVTGLKPHPAVPERRQQQLALGRLLHALRLPDASGRNAQGTAPFRRPQIAASDR